MGFSSATTSDGEESGIEEVSEENVAMMEEIKSLKRIVGQQDIRAQRGVLLTAAGVLGRARETENTEGVSSYAIVRVGSPNRHAPRHFSVSSRVDPVPPSQV